MKLPLPSHRIASFNLKLPLPRHRIASFKMKLPFRRHRIASFNWQQAFRRHRIGSFKMKQAFRRHRIGSFKMKGPIRRRVGLGKRVWLPAPLRGVGQGEAALKPLLQVVDKDLQAGILVPALLEDSGLGIVLGCSPIPGAVLVMDGIALLGKLFI